MLVLVLLVRMETRLRRNKKLVEKIKKTNIGAPLLRACINDVPKINIGKNQNQNWALIG